MGKNQSTAPGQTLDFDQCDTLAFLIPRTVRYSVHIYTALPSCLAGIWLGTEIYAGKYILCNFEFICLASSDM